jgi:PAS domain S-box-containing protein
MLKIVLFKTFSITMSLIKNITASGTSFTDLSSEKRNITLTNYISLVCAFAMVVLLIGRSLFAHVNFSIAITLLQGSFLFLVPIILNRFGYINASRLALCWLPSLYQLYATVRTMSETLAFESSAYVGLRFFILAFSCFPFLVFDLRKKALFFIGLMGPLLCLLFFDSVLNLYGFGYHQVGLADSSYEFNNIRVLVSVIIIGSSSFFLKSVVETGDATNEALVNELNRKNKVIQKRSESLLRASEQKYYSLFDQANDAILITSFKGAFTEVNASFCRLLGYSRQELLQMNISDVVDAEQLKAKPIFFDRLADGEHIITERKMVHKDGSTIDVEANVKKLDENGVMAIVRNVTELRKIQREVQLSEAKFRGAFEYSAIGMALLSLTGRYLRVNKELCNIVGYSEQQLLALTFRELTHPDDLSADLELLNKLMQGKIETYRLEKRYLHKNGGIVWVSLNVSLVKDSKNQPLYLVSQAENITENKIAHDQLMLSQANLNATINNTEIMIWSVDREMNIITFNKPFFNYVKQHYNVEVKPGSRVLSEYDDRSKDEIAEKWAQYYHRALAGEIVTYEQTRFGIDFHYSLSPIIEDSKVIGVSIFADNVTEQNLYEAELAEANKKIGELKLMALRSVMSPHFIFNVLNSIQFFIAKNDRLNAINYLSTFSKLIRSILTQSVNNKIKLADEIDMLKNYVQLEMTRFENKFDFKLEVNPDVDIDAIEIPSLLIQPYVENAILHGLYNKHEKGTLSIRIAEEGNFVVFEIEDDGVGRKAALELRKKNFPAHKSMGIKLTEERLRLINLHNSTGFEIEDLADDHGPLGTRVRIKIKC